MRRRQHAQPLSRQCASGPRQPDTRAIEHCHGASVDEQHSASPRIGAGRIAEPRASAKPRFLAQPHSHAVPEPRPHAQPDTDTDTDTHAKPKPKPKPESKPESKPEPEPESFTEPDARSDTDTDTQPRPDPGALRLPRRRP